MHLKSTILVFKRAGIYNSIMGLCGRESEILDKQHDWLPQRGSHVEKVKYQLHRRMTGNIKSATLLWVTWPYSFRNRNSFHLDQNFYRNDEIFCYSCNWLILDLFYFNNILIESPSAIYFQEHILETSWPRKVLPQKYITIFTL